MLVPKRHVLCLGLLDSHEQMELARLYSRVVFALREEYVFPGIFFEHGIVGQTINHAHLHVVPANGIITDKVGRDFPECSVTWLGKLRQFHLLCSCYTQKQEPYLFWSDDVGAAVLWNPSAPSQYLRRVVADALGRLERANWQVMDPELDRRLWSETVSRLKPYFI